MAGLYVHIPFCASRCFYCDFYSSTSLRWKADYIDALRRELILRREYLKSEPIRTVYFGGGTPSLLSADDFKSVFDTIYDNFKCEVEEVTMEANPEDMASRYIKELRTLPFDRISLGVQSFHDSDLRMINRRHSAQRAIDVVRNLQDEEFENISIDLIYGLPNQTVPSWMDNLQTAVSLSVPHVSAYSLTYEEGSVLSRMRNIGKVDEIDEDSSFEMFRLLRKVLSENGIRPYEISNFAQKGFESKHNSSYWNGVPYLGVGASAHSFDGTSRCWNIADIKKYIAGVNGGNGCLETECLDAGTRYNEFVMTGLRKAEGIELHEIARRFGESKLNYFRKMSKVFFTDGKLMSGDGRVRLSEEGVFISDYIIEKLLWVE